MSNLDQRPSPADLNQEISGQETVGETIPTPAAPSDALATGSRPPSPAVVDAGDSPSPWAPLAVPLFRAFWLASLVSNLGTWVHEIGAGWLMTNLDSSPEMVSAVRVAMSFPMTVLAIPAGVLADRIDRRRLLIITQWVMLTTTATLATLTLTGQITAWTLLGLTFVIGLGMVLHVLTWQATIPELVPRSQLSRAVALGSISFNLARSVGPAIGGILIAVSGPWIAFAANALSFAAVLTVLMRWKRENTESSNGLSYRRSLAEGIAYVRNHRQMRRTLMRLSMFMLPASALWALLPLVARQRLGWDAEGFGLLVTTVGAGAVSAAWLLHRMHAKIGTDRTIAISVLAFAGGMLGISLATGAAAAMTSMFVMGASWMTTLTTLNSEAQLALPNSMRARGMSCYVTVMAISMAGGSAIWGQIAGAISVPAAQQVAAATLVVTAAVIALGTLRPPETDGPPTA
ncbi:enterobactin exporter EntS [Rubripirellula lacrimiformis]|uniref:Enterobactin exporter EntS n=1 Tax=Rubripirellula lacrimiformis TaxID=1930273 RepID=A0A517NAJ0_9BACT|nr:MFS transporter [Rubripirellula lacrimiformis]QDT04156.1 enterobactin exporter EntS [Rubripirellula lacrimiformis]